MKKEERIENLKNSIPISSKDDLFDAFVFYEDMPPQTNNPEEDENIHIFEDDMKEVLNGDRDYIKNVEFDSDRRALHIEMKEVSLEDISNLLNLLHADEYVYQGKNVISFFFD